MTPKKRRPAAPRGAARRQRKRQQSRRARWLAAALAAIAVAAAVTAAIAVTLGGGRSLQETLAAADCTLRTFPSQGRDHVVELPDRFQYNSLPPTSGPHHPQPAVWDFYDHPLPQIQLVHNLEHGGIVVQYGTGVSRATVARIRNWYRRDPVGIVVAPLPALSDRIALTAWTHLASCPSFDEDAFDAFRDAYRFKGPERPPPSSLSPIRPRERTTASAAEPKPASGAENAEPKVAEKAVQGGVVVVDDKRPPLRRTFGTGLAHSCGFVGKAQGSSRKGTAKHRK